MSRLNKILLGMLALQLVLAVFVLTRSGEKVTFREAPVLPGFDAAAVTRVQIFADSSDKAAIDVVKRGSDWVLASHFDYPVDASKVTAALAPLAGMKAGDPIATSATHHQQFQVADKEFEKKLVLTSGGKDQTIYLGSPALLHRVAVRIGGEERVLGASGVSSAALSSAPRDWIKPTYSEIPRDDIDKITIQRGVVTIDLDRTAPAPAGSGSAGSDGTGSGAAAPSRTWKVTVGGAPLVLATGESIDTFAIDTVASEVASIEAQPADPKRDVANPTAVVTVVKKGGASVVFDVVAEGEQLWIKQHGLERATKVDKARFEAVMTAERARLVIKPAGTGSGSGSGSGSGGPLPPPRP